MKDKRREKAIGMVVLAEIMAEPLVWRRSVWRRIATYSLEYRGSRVIVFTRPVTTKTLGDRFRINVSTMTARHWIERYLNGQTDEDIAAHNGQGGNQHDAELPRNTMLAVAGKNVRKARP